MHAIAKKSSNNLPKKLCVVLILLWTRCRNYFPKSLIVDLLLRLTKTINYFIDLGNINIL